jgi:hypothetical protein
MPLHVEARSEYQEILKNLLVLKLFLGMYTLHMHRLNRGIYSWKRWEALGSTIKVGMSFAQKNGRLTVAKAGEIWVLIPT